MPTPSKTSSQIKPPSLSAGAATLLGQKPATAAPPKPNSAAAELAEIELRRRRAREVSELNLASLEAHKELFDLEKSIDPDWRTAAEEFDVGAKEILQRHAAKMTSETALNEFKTRFDKIAKPRLLSVRANAIQAQVSAEQQTIGKARDFYLDIARNGKTLADRTQAKSLFQSFVGQAADAQLITPNQASSWLSSFTALLGQGAMLPSTSASAAAGEPKFDKQSPSTVGPITQWNTTSRNFNIGENVPQSGTSNEPPLQSQYSPARPGNLLEPKEERGKPVDLFHERAEPPGEGWKPIFDYETHEFLGWTLPPGEMPQGGEVTLNDVIDVVVAIGQDVGDVPEMGIQMVQGARDGVQEMLDSIAWLNKEIERGKDGLYGLAGLERNVADGLTGESWITLPNVAGEPKTYSAGAVRALTQFFTGFGAAGKGLKVLRFASSKKGVIMLKSIFSSAFAFDPGDQNMAGLLREWTGLEDPITEFLATNPNDEPALNRLRNALEDIIPAAAFEGIVRGLRLYRARNALRTEEAAEFIGADVPVVDGVKGGKRSRPPKSSTLQDDAPAPRQETRVEEIERVRGSSRPLLTRMWSRLQEHGVASLKHGTDPEGRAIDARFLAGLDGLTNDEVDELMRLLPDDFRAAKETEFDMVEGTGAVTNTPKMGPAGEEFYTEVIQGSEFPSDLLLRKGVMSHELWHVINRVRNYLATNMPDPATNKEFYDQLRAASYRTYEAQGREFDRFMATGKSNRAYEEGMADTFAMYLALGRREVDKVAPMVGKFLRSKINTDPKFKDVIGLLSIVGLAQARGLLEMAEPQPPGPT